jgi:hypothetical protein
MCLNETRSSVGVGKYLFYMFPVRFGLRQGHDLSPLILNFTLYYAIRGSGKPGWLEI